MNKSNSNKDVKKTLLAEAIAVANSEEPTEELAQPEPRPSNEITDKESVRKLLAEMLASCTTAKTALAVVPRAEALAQYHHRDVDIRRNLLELKSRAGLDEHILEEWLSFINDHPGDVRTAREYALRLAKSKGFEDSLAFINGYIPETIEDPKQGMTRAELLADIKAHQESDDLFRRLLEKHDRRDIRVGFAKRLAKRGMLADAFEAVSPVANTLPSESKGAVLAAKILDDYRFFKQFESESDLTGQDVRVVAMKQAILRFQDRSISLSQPGGETSVALVTGSLGPGGAERQLTRLASNLKRLATSKMSVGSSDNVKMVGRIEVIVKQYSEIAKSPRAQRKDFFLKDLVAAGVDVAEIDRMRPVMPSNQDVEDADLLRLLEYLPPQVHYGVTRLMPYLRARAFDVVSLWQDGTCLVGALAALLAGAPTIHLVFRGLPPNIRRERHRPEYETLYRALAKIPGVHFVSNSRAGAQAYADWLALPVDRFRILYNGVPDVDVSASEEEAERWASFAERTSDASETIGGVFRLEPDKRPLLWIKLAHRYLKRRPYARFVIVGDGRFRDEAMALARELGIADRLLLAGLSGHVGFWYSKMDVKVLLSRHEGLPNVLIEAQLLGVCTVSTPAGGAGECFVDGVTGHLLGCAESPDLEEACIKIEELVSKSQASASVAEYANQRAKMLFSVEAMLGVFIELCSGGSQDDRQHAPELLEAK